MTHHAIADYQLRSAQEEDFPEVARLLTASNLPADDIEEIPGSFVLALAEDRVIGVAGVEQCGRYGLLRSVAVDPDWRDAGVGRALVDRAIADASSKGLDPLYLLTTTAEKYFPAFGFEKIDRDKAPEEIRKTSQFTDLCPSSATLMRRSGAD